MIRLLCLTLAVCAASQPLAAQRHAKLVARIDSLARAALREGPAPGLSLAVVRGRDTIVARGYGYARLDDSLPATPETVYPIASITKQFTAAAVMQLAAADRLKLKDDLTKYLPDFPTQGHKVTIQQLLNHTSGIRDYTALGPRWLDRVEADLSTQDFVALFQDEPFDFPPGEKFAYTNSGYYLLGLVIERISGEAYGDYIRDHLFAPAAMIASRYCDAAGADRAQGYDLKDGALVPARRMSMTQLFAAGGLCSTVRDLIRWQRALVDRKVVNALSWRLMTEPAELKDGSHASYGFGVTLGRMGTHRLLGHGGAVAGFSSQLSFFPDDQLTVVVLANSEHVLTRRLADRIAGAVLGIVEPKVKDLPLTAMELERYAGGYVMAGESLAVSGADGKLMLRFGTGDALRLLYQGSNEFVVESDPTTKVYFRVSHGRATGLVFTAGELTLNAERKP